MSEGRVECPSGLVLDVRGFKVSEANVFASESANKEGTVADRVFDACWKATVDPGPYTMGPDGRPDWSKLHVGDRLYLLIRIRAITYPKPYAFRVNCPARGCRKPFDWELDLNALPVKPMPAAAREALKGDRTLEIQSFGKKVRFRLLVGEDEKKNLKLLRSKKDAIVLAALNLRIVSIEGVEDKLTFLEALDMEPALDLRDAMDDADGGVDTDIQVICTHCDTQFDIRLPFGEEFYVPRRVRPISAEATEEKGTSTEPATRP